MNRPNNIVRIPTTLDSTFFKFWFLFLEPLHKLTEREIDVIASFVKLRFELSEVIKDAEILDKVVMNEENKRKIREACNIANPYFQVIMGKLRKKKVIINGRLNPRYIPNVSKDANNFQLLLLFDMKNES